MPYKARSESVLLRIMRILNTRMELTADEQKYYLYLEKGFKGEVEFDLLTEKLQCDCYILNDLQLEINMTSFQIDSLIFHQDTIYLFEVKNYEGDYCFHPEKFETLSGFEVKNPLDQLKRSKFLLRQILQNTGNNLIIEGYVVFINPQFTLYQIPPNLPFILPTQLDRFINTFDKKPSLLNTFHKSLADKLISLHQPDSRYTQLPSYEYNQLKKGITCKACNSFSMSILSKKKKVVCSECGYEEMTTLAVIRSVNDFNLLFPNLKITTHIIHDWCSVVNSKKVISRILGKNLAITGLRRWAFYE